MDNLTFKLNNKTARRLSYMIGRSEEANYIVNSAINAAKAAEANVRSMVDLIADQAGCKLPERYGISFDEDDNEITVKTEFAEPLVDPNKPDLLHVNGIL